MLGTMMIHGMHFLAPMNQLMVNFGWIDTYWSLIVPGAMTAFGMFLFRQAMIGIPNDLIEAGRIDGCGEFAIYFKLVMPLVRPMSGAFCLISFMGAWNNFLGPQIFLHTESKMPLPVILAQFINVYEQQYGVFLAGTLLAIIPPGHPVLRTAERVHRRLDVRRGKGLKQLYRALDDFWMDCFSGEHTIRRHFLNLYQVVS
jgi:ABC-type glycerol-3-phosphate transport system permease component